MEEKIKREQIRYIFVNGIQRVPDLFNEIHYLMEAYPACQFIMTVSSARNLRRGGVNRLAGRSFKRFLFSFVYHEFNEKKSLDEILKFGTLPPLFDKNTSQKEEILLVLPVML